MEVLDGLAVVNWRAGVWCRAWRWYAVFRFLFVRLNKYQLLHWESLIELQSCWGTSPSGPVKNMPAKAEGRCSIPDLGRSHMPQGN